MCIARWWHSKGFGIQSPWAYRLVTTVLQDRKDLRPRLEKYFAATQQGEAATQQGAPSTSSGTGNDEQGAGEVVRWVLLEDIRGRDREEWKRIVADPEATAVFDMRTQALVVYDPKRYKQIYRI